MINNIVNMIKNNKIIFVIALLFSIVAFFIVRHIYLYSEERKSVSMVTQDNFNDNLVLKEKLKISTENIKLLQNQLNDIKNNNIKPNVTYYVESKNVTDGAKELNKQIKNKDERLPKILLDKSDKTIVIPIVKDKFNNDLPLNQQKIDVYKINLNKNNKIKAGLTIFDNKIYPAVGYENKNSEIILHLKDKDIKRITYMRTIAKW